MLTSAPCSPGSRCAERPWGAVPWPFPGHVSPSLLVSQTRSWGGRSPASGAALLLGVRTETLCVTSEVTPVMNSSDSISGGKHFLHCRLMCFPFVVRNENLCSRWCPLPPELQMVPSQRDADHSCWAPRLLVGSCPPWERILHLFLWSCSCWFAFTLGNAVVLKKNPKF